MNSNTVQSGAITEIKPEQVTTLYRKTMLGFWGNLILAAIITVFIIRDHQPSLSTTSINYNVIIWLVLLIATCFYRLNLTRQFNPAHYHESGSLVLWANKHILLTTIINTIWGVAGFVLLPADFPHQVLMTVILFSVLLISFPILAISRFAYIIQLFAVLTPIVVSLFLNNSYPDTFSLLPIGIIIFAGTLFSVTEYIHHMLMELRDSQTTLKKQANTDSLTQISNRRAFDQTFKNEWRRTTRDELPIAMLLINIDHFSKFNDAQGQRAGDSCLRSIAACMEVVTRRPADLAARYSGEEFAVLLPNTTMENATMLGEKLRDKVEQLQIPHPASEHKVVTVSVGVSCCEPKTAEELEASEEEDVMFPAMLMNAADNAMYLAKKQGRNRIAEQKCGEQRLALVLQKYAEKEASRT